MRYLLLLIFPILLFGSKILSYNVYERSDRVDMMLTFDTPYEGAIHQNRESNSIVVKLNDATIESKKIKDISSEFVLKLSLVPIGLNTKIIAIAPKHTNLQISKTADSYGLRFRFSKKSVEKESNKESVLNKTGSNLPTKIENQFGDSYYIVIAILIIGIGVLLWLKKGINSQNGLNKGSIFGGLSKKSSETSVRFQKNLDPKNKVMMIDHGDESYLILVGNSNILLDKFHNSKPVKSQNEFNDMLETGKYELDKFMQLGDSKQNDNFKKYKEKAASMS